MNATSASADAPSSLYRAIWRWHFYAGLMVLPFMVLLAVTGGLYLFHIELDAFWHRDLKQVEARETAPLWPARLIENHGAHSLVTASLPTGPQRRIPHAAQ